MRRFKLAYTVVVLILTSLFIKNSAFAAGLFSDGTNRNTVRAGFFCQSGLFNVEDGVYSGYAYEVFNRLNQYNDWDLSFYEVSDSDYPFGPRELLINNQIDLFIGNSNLVNSNSEGNELICSEYDIGNSPFLLAVKKDEADLYPDFQYSKWPVVKIGYYPGNPSVEEFKKFAKNKGIRFSLTPIDYVSNENVFEAHPNIDAFVSSSFREINYDYEVPKSYFGENYLFVITRADEKELMDQVNSAINKILQYDSTCFSDLSRKFFSFDSSEIMLFTREEREYIESHQGQPLYALAYVNIEPYLYLDDSNHYAGIIPEYIKLLNERTGLNIRIIGKNSVNEYQYGVYSNAYPLCLNERYDFNLANAHGVRLTNPYLSIPVSRVYTSEATSKINKIGVFTIHKGDRLSYIDKSVVDYDSADYYSKAEDMLDDLLNHKIDCAFMPQHLLSPLINNNKYSGLIVDNVEDCSIRLCIGVCDADDLILANLISKATNYIDNSQTQEIINRELENYALSYTISDFVKEHDWIVWTILWGGVTLITIFIVLTMRTRNAEREKRLAEENIQYYKTVLSTNIFVVEVVMEENNQRNYFYYRIDIDENGEHIIKSQEYDEDFDKFALKIHPDDIETFKEMFSDASMDELIKSKKTDYKEIRCKIEGNNYAYLGVTLQPLVGDDRRVLVLVKDVSSAKIEEEEKRKTLQVALDTAKAMGDSKNTFLSQISHDLRTPMNAIVGMTALAQLNIEDEDKVRECLDTISNSSEHLLALLNDILDVTRIESGRFTFNQKRIRIKSVLQNTLLMLERKAKEYNVTINVDVSSVKHDFIISDENRLEQVFSNIISNAIKYSKTGSSIDVSLKELNNQHMNEFYYDFIVQDHGIGMSDDTLEKLFVPFERGQEAIGKEGTGLGMTITKSIVDALGGLISVDSELGVGTTFIVSLSFSDDVSSSLAGIDDIDGKNALILCQDASMSELLTDIFKEGNMTVYTTNDPNDEVILENEYTVIAVSLIKSLEEEIKVLSDVRKKVGRKPIIFDVSYENPSSTSEIAKSIRIDGFVAIPCYKENVTRIVLDALESRKISKKIRIKKNQQGLNALIVEDVEINAIFAQAIAEMKGFTTTIATNGQEAFEILEKSADEYYSIVFMDIQMPVLNGYDATRLIRKSKRKYLKEIPIIAMSANTFPEDIIKSRNAGMNDHISKPIDLNKFSDITDKYIVR